MVKITHMSRRSDGKRCKPDAAAAESRWSNGGLNVRVSTISWQACKVGRSTEDSGEQKAARLEGQQRIRENRKTEQARVCTVNCVLQQSLGGRRGEGESGMVGGRAVAGR